LKTVCTRKRHSWCGCWTKQRRPLPCRQRRKRHKGFKVNTMTMTKTRNARQEKILEILGKTRVTSQVQLSDLLLDEGIDITQATLSRDLDVLGAKKVKRDGGRSFYFVLVRVE